MCLAVRSSQHLQFVFVHEQMWPRLDDDRLIYEECYDLIIRSFSDDPVERLHVLSPFRLQQADNGFQELAEVAKFNWIFDALPAETKSLADGSQIYDLHFRGETAEGENRFEAVRLHPKLGHVDWGQTDPHQVAAMVGTEMTLALLDLTGGPAIERFDPRRADETTYWLRLTYSAERASTSSPAVFGCNQNQEPLFRVKPCAIFSPDEVIADLDSKFDLLSRNPHIRDGALKAKKAVIGELLRKPGSSVQILDHRISIVTGQQRVLVLNMHHEGACSYSGVEEVLEMDPFTVVTDVNRDSKTHFVRNYFTGANFFPGTDALTLAGHSSNYLRTFATDEKHAKTKEEITSAIGAVSHANVGHVIDVLTRFDFARSSANRFFVDSRCRKDDLAEPGLAEPGLLADLYQPPVDLQNHPRQGFSPRGYRIDFDFAFA